MRYTLLKRLLIRLISLRSPSRAIVAATILVLLLAASPSCQASVVTCNVSMGPLASGTNCGAGWQAGTSEGITAPPPFYWIWRSISHVDFYIGGELTVQKDYPYPTQSCSQPVIYDSTHFAGGQSITVKAIVTTNLSEVETFETPAKIVYNKGYDLVNQTLTGGPGETGAIVGLELSAQAKHTVLAASDHVKATILANLPTYTVFFIYTHGSQAVFGDCFVDNTPGVGAYLTAQEVGNANAQKGQLPPYCFVQFQACSVFANGDSSMASAFGIGPGSIDRAALGWSEDMAYGGPNEWWIQDLWAALCTNGRTLEQAIAQANVGQQHFGGDGCWVALFQHKIPPTVIGDMSMKVHGVYGGTDLQWWR